MTLLLFDKSYYLGVILLSLGGGGGLLDRRHIFERGVQYKLNILEGVFTWNLFRMGLY